jgi:anti-sigma regulatory factor (Ser/Thr protein kinase)
MVGHPHRTPEGSEPQTPRRFDHRAELYDDDEQLVAGVIEYLRPALAAGGAAIAIVTAEHRELFAAGLARAGVDVTAAQAAGTLIILDAAEMLALVMADGAPDLVALSSLADGVLAGLARHGGPVRGYGEAVALLWEQGRIDAVMALEDLWDAQAARHGIGLQCGYPSMLFTRDDAEQFTAMCGHHSSTTVPPGHPLADLSVSGGPPRSTELTFPAELTSGAQVRVQLRRILADWQLPALLDDAELLATELVNNAVVHARSEVRLSLQHDGSVLRIAVTDTGPGTIRRPRPTMDASHGRGLALVHALSADWGTRLDADGTTLWFELHTPAERAEASSRPR